MPETTPDQFVSYSSLGLHRTCPQAWHYRHVQGLRKADEVTAYPLELGSWWHALRAADAIARGSTIGSLLSCPKEIRTTDDGPVLTREGPHVVGEVPLYRVKEGGPTYIVSAALVLAVAKAWWAKLSETQREGWVEEIGQSVPERLAHMDRLWRTRWAEDLKNEEPIGVEVKWIASLPNTEAQMIGYVDEVYRDRKRGLVVARDAKTANKIEAASAFTDLLDSQLHVYVWGLGEWAKEKGVKISAISYDRIRSAMPKSPSVTATGSLSKSVTDYDLHTYLDWAAGPDGEGVPWGEPDTFVKSGKRAGEPKWGSYVAEEAVVEKLSSPVALAIWADRTLVPLNRNMVRGHLQAAVDTQQDAERTMLRITERGEAPRNFTRRGCQFCEFSSLCIAQMTGGPKGEYPLADYGLKEKSRTT